MRRRERKRIEGRHNQTKIQRRERKDEGNYRKKITKDYNIREGWTWMEERNKQTQQCKEGNERN